MKRILNRYILRELIPPFVVSLLVLTFTMVSGNLLKLSDLIVNKGVSLGIVLRLFTFFLPYLIGYTLPMAFLAAVIITFGRLSQDHEIIAMRSCGINIFKIIAPVLFLALLLSGFSIFINNPLVAQAHFKMRILLLNLGYQSPETLLEPGKFINTFDGYTFYIKDIKGNRLSQVIIYEHMDDNTVRTVTAKQGTVEISPDQTNLILRLEDGTADEPDPNNPQKFYKMKFKTFPITLNTNKDEQMMKYKYKRSKEMTLSEIKQEIRVLDQESLSTIRLKAEYHRKISFSFACFVFALIGAPLAIFAQRGERSASLAYTLVLALAYYILFTLGKSLAETEYLPPIVAMWLPNLIIGSLGLGLLYKVQRV